MISAKNGRPPPPVPPRPSKQVVAEALAKNKLPKSISHVTKQIDRSEKAIGNYVNHNVIKKREDLLNAKNATNDKNPSVVAWGGTVIYRSPSFIKEEEKKKLEEAEKQNKYKMNLKSDVNDKTNKVSNIDVSKSAKPKCTLPNKPAAKMSSFDNIHCLGKAEDETVKNNMNNVNDIAKCPSVKDIIKNLHEEKIENVSHFKINTRKFENANVISNQFVDSKIRNENDKINNSQQKINDDSGYFNNSIEILKSLEESPSNNKQKLVMEEYNKSNNKSFKIISESKINISNEKPGNLKELNCQDKSTSVPDVKSCNNTQQINKNHKSDVHPKTSITKVAITASSDNHIGSLDETRIVVGGGSNSSSRIFSNAVPTTTTTIEIRDGESTTSSIISKTISNSVQIKLCSTELSRSFGDASLSVRPEPEGGETEKPNVEKPRTASPLSGKKSAVSFSDTANHELLISELQDMRQEQRIRKRQRQPDQEDAASKPRLDSSVDTSYQKSETSTLDDQDLDSISTSDWTEISNDGAEVLYSSCRITLDSNDADVINSRERRDSGNSSSNSESPSLCRMSASLPPGLPPLPKSLSGFELRTSGSGSVSQMQSRPPPPEPPRTGRPQATLDTQLAVLRREMFGLRQLDLSLLSQLWALNESIQDFRQMLQDQEQEQDDDCGPLSPPSPGSATPPSSSEELVTAESNEDASPAHAVNANVRSVSNHRDIPPASAPVPQRPPVVPPPPRPRPAARTRPAPPPPPPARRGPGKTSAV